MINGKRIAVVLPLITRRRRWKRRCGNYPTWSISAFWSTITAPIAHRGGAPSWAAVLRTQRNYGYGRNQQTCYREALAAGADVVIMVHPDYQYTPLLVTAWRA